MSDTHRTLSHSGCQQSWCKQCSQIRAYSFQQGSRGEPLGWPQVGYKQPTQYVDSPTSQYCNQSRDHEPPSPDQRVEIVLRVATDGVLPNGGSNCEVRCLPLVRRLERRLRRRHVPHQCKIVLSTNPEFLQFDTKASAEEATEKLETESMK